MSRATRDRPNSAINRVFGGSVSFAHLCPESLHFRDLLARAGFESGIVTSDLQTVIQWKRLGRKEYISCESSLQIYVACWKISFLWGHLYFNGGNEF